MDASSTTPSASGKGKGNNAAAGCDSSYFCCVHCGSSSRCWHKLDIAQKIWFTPNDVRTSSELRCLSREEREIVWADITANSKGANYKINDEQNEFVEDCLVKMQQEVDKIMLSSKPSKSCDIGKAIYKSVLESNPTYVTSRAFRLSFLRSERFHAKHAAKRLIKHFKMKQYLFSSGKGNGSASSNKLMGRDVQVCDLSPKDQPQQNILANESSNASSSVSIAKAISSPGVAVARATAAATLNGELLSDGIVGQARDSPAHSPRGGNAAAGKNNNASNIDGPAFRFLSQPDHAGRDIIFHRPSQVNYNDIKSEIRSQWVTMNTHISQNVNTQKRGCVLLLSTQDDYPLNMNYEYLRLQLQLIQSTPIRLVAIYILASTPSTSLRDAGSAGSAAAASANNRGASNTIGGSWDNAIEFATYIMGKTLRLRTRCIRGSPMECRYQLLCLGFAPNNLPKELMVQANEQEQQDQKKKRKAARPDRNPDQHQQQREFAAGGGRPQVPLQVSTVILDDD